MKRLYTIAALAAIMLASCGEVATALTQRGVAECPVTKTYFMDIDVHHVLVDVDETATKIENMEGVTLKIWHPFIDVWEIKGEYDNGCETDTYVIRSVEE